jgi:hypothetical protein
MTKLEKLEEAHELLEKAAVLLDEVSYPIEAGPVTLQTALRSSRRSSPKIPLGSAGSRAARWTSSVRSRSTTFKEHAVKSA